jgi:hypothetical protein
MAYLIIAKRGVASLASAATQTCSIAILALLGGCAFPLSPFVDTEPTGAIKPVASPLSSELDSEDWRIAEPILAQALRSSAP